MSIERVMRCGIRENPPALGFEFVKAGRLCHCSVDICAVSVDTTADDICRKLRETKPQLTDAVDAAELRHAVQMLLNFLSAGGAATVSKAAAKADWANNIDLNRASNEIVNKAKEDMDEAFQRSRITKDDPNWVYDKEVDFGDGEEDSGWD
eukprot:CAMPEP_0118886082 /NCGR_PEP_ID=MMETSP1163-20130328/24301_1 /TAXON_ID=124430 /ORGANISM="Phaeomonas parva, Strain CCMP2877" /LENGTH=150 /DNA_ID=CAMNT_0006824217 /DNA_START=71 /DNA_END=523 /DNA_ORIENTATION=+